MKRLMILAVAALCSAGAMAATSPSISNGSFETNVVGNGYWYGAFGPAASDWSFTGGSGVSASYTAWDGVASSGNAFAFLQNTASLSQTFTSTSLANYTFDFDLALRPGYYAGQAVSVSLDGAVLGTYTASLGWSNLSVSANSISAGTHTLSFSGLNPVSAPDTSAFIDNISMNVSAVPEADTYAMLLAGLGLVGFVARRRKGAAV